MTVLIILLSAYPLPLASIFFNPIGSLSGLSFSFASLRLCGRIFKNGFLHLNFGS
jgi:hypothetical protein